MFRRKSPDDIPKLKKSGVLPAAIAILLPLVFVGGAMLQSRAAPRPPPDPEEIFGEAPMLRAGCTFDVDLPQLPSQTADGHQQWVDCEPLLPPLEATWTPGSPATPASPLGSLEYVASGRGERPVARVIAVDGVDP